MEINNDLNNVALTNVDTAVKPQLGASEIMPQLQEQAGDQLSEIFISLKQGGSMLADILKLAGFKVTPENMKMIQEMIQNNLPVNNEMLKAFNQAVKLMGGDFDKALFLVKNEMSMTSKNAQTLNSFAKHETTVLNELKTLAAAVEELQDPVMKTHIAEILTGEKPAVKPALTDLIHNIKPNLSPDKVSEAIKSDAVLLEMLDLPEEEFANTVGKLTEKFPDLKAEIETAAKLVLQAKQTLAEIKPELMAKLADLPKEEKQILIPRKIDEALKEAFSEKGIDLEPIVKEKILQELGIKAEKDFPLYDKIIDKYIFKPGKNERKDIDKLLNELKDNLQSVKAEFSKQGAAAPRITEIADKITRDIEFLNEIKNSTFIQIPMQLGNKEVNGELYVFKDKRPKKGGSGGSASALLALDLSNLGHLEAYIKKENKSVSCQFRAVNELTAGIIKANIGKLEENLQAHGYTILSLSFKTVDEPFTLLDKEPALSDELIPVKDDVKIGLDAKA